MLYLMAAEASTSASMQPVLQNWEDKHSLKEMSIQIELKDIT